MAMMQFFSLHSGSSHDFISASFVQQHGLKTQPMEDILSVTLADGRKTSEPRLTTLPLKVKLADENERLTFTVFPMSRYNVILGRPWLTKNNPQINYRTNQVKPQSGHQWTASLTTEPSRETPDVELNFITGKQARHSLRQGKEGQVSCNWLGCLHQTLLKKTLSSTLTQLEIKRVNFSIFLTSIVMFFLRSCHTRYPQKEQSTTTST